MGKWNIVDIHKKENERLRSLNAELLEALELLWGWHASNLAGLDRIREQAEAAIAKARGNQVS